jgi:hypothetical protein
VSEFKGYVDKCAGATSQFVRYSKNKDFFWLQPVNVLCLMFPGLLLGVGAKRCRFKCPGATCQFVRNSKNKDFSWLQLVNVLCLMFRVLLLDV